jgi:sugar O-acyltransferase (sialic acid O-acetyltransferase NeuD family)
MKTSKELVVLGAGGFAAEVIEAAELAGWVVTGLYDDTPEALGRRILGRTCLGTLAEFMRAPKTGFVFAIGNNEARQKLGAEIEWHGHESSAVIHPSAVVSRSAIIMPGAFVGATAFVGPQAKIGHHAIVNVGSSVGHDAVLGDFSQLCPGARVSGFSVLEVGAFMGSNAVLGPRGRMESWSKLGASSFVPRVVPAHSLAVGVPARVVSV